MTSCVSVNSNDVSAYNVDSLGIQTNKKPEIQQATEKAAISALESLPAPNTGSRGGRASYGILREAAAVFAGGALANVSIWGTGMGMWVIAGDNERILFTGKVLTFAGIGSAFVMTLIVCIAKNIKNKFD